jgi:hypothetical protein
MSSHIPCIQHTSLNFEFDHPAMCIVTLSVVKKCQHELATIDLCRRACNDIAEDTNLAAVVSGEEPLPRITCTPSLGWTIFETLNVRTLLQERQIVANIAAGTGSLRVVQGVVGEE